MALLSTDASTTNKVDFGSGSSLDDLADITILTWMNLSSLPTGGAARQIVTKNGAASSAFFLDTSARPAYVRSYATTNAAATATAANLNLSTNTWWFGGVTNNASAGPKLWGGTLAITVAEAAAYAVGPTTGVGALTSDAAANLRTMGGGNGSTANGMPGTMAWVGIWNRVLTLGEIQAQQYHPHVTSGCVLFCHHGLVSTSATQPDWSGNGNNGTVTGMSMAAHAPILPIYGGFAGWRGNYTAPVAAGQPLVKRYSGIPHMRRGSVTFGHGWSA